ncbi:Uma2 family endonuclease [Pseudonocardia sp. CA-107938]|uniref:Uma2 family endonuclease n=1 Tax=Pseudonocardia sp. CA-107938 TaxID=3240021 RepID=UPI003D91BF52
MAEGPGADTDVDPVFGAIVRARQWTDDDVLAIGATPARVEHVDGQLLIQPADGPEHDRLVARVAEALGRSRPAGVDVVIRARVRLWPTHIRIPDVTLLRPGPDPRVTEVSDVALVCEVTAPGVFEHDTRWKHVDYAEAGIPFYVRVDFHRGVEDLTATAFELVGGHFVELAHAPDGVLRLQRPWPVEIDLRAAASGQ